jgi:hypothetical protein
MGDLTRDELNRYNDCVDKCNEDLQRCLKHWNKYDKRHPKGDPNVVKRGMDRCINTQFDDLQKCGVQRRHFTDPEKEGIREAGRALSYVGGISAIGGIGAATLFSAPLVGGSYLVLAERALWLPLFF